ncbi:6755_t:CDS:2 [Acaulospora colombiana]|uniref:6755_t:CDS:1 n=1 Tax=Acaulospora colombiana TaxID=27376 RepID=A0ACA9MGP0_9GLOM|nr:6755_t:CDS:2 [Acaulospora colombiana]
MGIVLLEANVTEGLIIISPISIAKGREIDRPGDDGLYRANHVRPPSPVQKTRRTDKEVKGIGITRDRDNEGQGGGQAFNEPMTASSKRPEMTGWGYRRKFEGKMMAAKRTGKGETNSLYDQIHPRVSRTGRRFAVVKKEPGYSNEWRRLLLLSQTKSGLCPSNSIDRHGHFGPELALEKESLRHAMGKIWAVPYSSEFLIQCERLEEGEKERGKRGTSGQEPRTCQKKGPQNDTHAITMYRVVRNES